jgi:hypothetical protein
MAVFLFISLFLLGVGLSIIGQAIGLVTAFQESSTWGVMSLLVPFASFVFLVKFWDRLWVRRSLWISLLGMGLMIASVVVVAVNPGEFEPAPLDTTETESKVRDSLNN